MTKNKFYLALFSFLCSFTLNAQSKNSQKIVSDTTLIFDNAKTHIRLSTTNNSLIGKGRDQAIAKVQVRFDRPRKIENITFDISSSDDLKLIENINLYSEKYNFDRFDNRKEKATISSIMPNSRIFKIYQKADTIFNFWVTLDIKDTSKEGTKIDFAINSIKANGQKAYSTKLKNYKNTHEVVLERSLIWAPGDEGSKNYRIPAIVQMSNGDIVASIDRRKNNQNDLPNDIDVEVKISKDMGKTWSMPITVAKGTPEQGFGDAAMATDGNTIHMLMASGRGLWEPKPNRMFYSKSEDMGKSWTTPREISAEVMNGEYRFGGFIGSGNGIIDSKGRIAFVAALRTDSIWGGNTDNVLVYSEDNGKTWQHGTKMRSQGDESKVVELPNGDLLISSRNRAWDHPTERSWMISKDRGQTWSETHTWKELFGNNCDAGIVNYYHKEKDGSTKHYLIHSFPHDAKRRNLKLFISEDMGLSWNEAVTICNGEAAYSELVILNDNSIGIISEEQDNPAYNIYFTRISPEYLFKNYKK